MSLRPLPWPEPAEEIVAAVRAMYRGREVPLPVAVRDQLGELFADEQFTETFGARGKPGLNPDSRYSAASPMKGSSRGQTVQARHRPVIRW
jgi:hypothetical protein